jgi:hypothetical protein
MESGPTNRLERRVELIATVLLAVAAVATAWAAYQSGRWHSQQAKGQSAGIAARVESTRAANVANRQGQIDVALFTQWVDAYARNVFYIFLLYILLFSKGTLIKLTTSTCFTLFFANLKHIFELARALYIKIEINVKALKIKE